MAREYAVEIEWVPFELHPETPPEGYVREERSKAARTGMRDHLYRLAEEAGLPLTSNRTVANAHHALEAGEWARAQGPEAFDAVHRALFNAYFGEARNVSTIDQVIEALADTGLDTQSLRADLEAGTYRELIDQVTEGARRNGISGTPTFIFEDTFVIGGAQDFEVFADFLDQLGVPRRAGVEPGPLRPDAVSRREARADEAALEDVIALDEIE